MRYDELSSCPNFVTVVIPREQRDLVFKFATVADYTEFETMCPRPVPPNKIFPGGKTEPRMDDPAYMAACQTHIDRHAAWLFLKSISATSFIKWDTVDMLKPETWVDYEKELLDFGFAKAEIQRLVIAAWQANGLDNEKIDAATKSFLASEQQAASKK